MPSVYLLPLLTLSLAYHVIDPLDELRCLCTQVSELPLSYQFARSEASNMKCTDLEIDFR